MKKAILFLSFSAFIFQANAQNADNKTIMLGQETNLFKGNTLKTNFPGNVSSKSTNQASKGTGTTDRWYSHVEALGHLNNKLDTTLAFYPIWFDSTILVNYTSGASNINFSSVTSTVNPSSFLFNNTSISEYNGQMGITSTDAYSVDSININLAYVRRTAKPNVVDTMIFSVAPTSGAGYWTRQTSAWTANYLPTGKDTLYVFRHGSVDTPNRALKSMATGTNRIIWKMPLTAAMGDEDGTIQSFTMPVGGSSPTSLNIPAGYGMSLSATFKSGDTWVANQDTIDKMNIVYTVFHNWGDGQRMPYYFYDYNDRNGSAMMFSTYLGYYSPTIGIEGTNQPTFGGEFLSADFHVKCPTCNLVSGVKNVIEITSNAYPNPAQDLMTINYSLNETANTSLVVTNSIGQKVAQQDLGKISAKTQQSTTIKTANLPAGVYFYTIDANGQRTTQRFVVAH